MIVEGKRKTFHDINRLKEFMSRKPALQRILEAMQRAEGRKPTIPKQQQKILNKGTTVEIQT